MRCNSIYLTNLFHDILEVYTKDIITPVKKDIKNLDNTLKKHEAKIIKKKILPLLPKKLRRDFNYYINEPFKDRFYKEKATLKNLTKDIKKRGVDGSLMKVADHLSAYTEIKLSIDSGISSIEHKNLINYFLEKYTDYKLYGLDIKCYFLNSL